MQLTDNWQEWPDQVKNKYLSKLQNMSAFEDNDYSDYADDPVGFCENIFDETYTDDVKKIMESVRDNEITIAQSSTGVGKTHSAARIASWFYKVYPGQAKVYTAAAPPFDNLNDLLWGEIKQLHVDHPKVFQNDNILSSLKISSSPNSYIVGVTIPSTGTDSIREAKFSGKHAPYLLFVLDEADAIPDEVFRGIEGCLSGGKGRLLIMFNPRHKTGAAYRLIRDGKANVINLSAFNHPNVRTGEDIYCGAVTRNKTIKRINDWCRPLANDESPDSECFELPKFLNGLTCEKKKNVFYDPLKPGWYRIIESQFSYMVLGEYPSQGTNQLISIEWINLARSRYDSYVAECGVVPPHATKAVMGQDVADMGDDYNVSCFRYGGFVEPLIMWNGMNPIETGERAATEYKKRNVSYCNVDSTGVGAGVAPHLNKNRCIGKRIMVASTPTYKTPMGQFKILRDQLWWSCREWLKNDNSAMLPPDEKLIDELLVASYEIKKGKVVVLEKSKMKKLLGRSPDRADALNLTFAPTPIVKITRL